MVFTWSDLVEAARRNLLFSFSYSGSEVKIDFQFSLVEKKLPILDQEDFTTDISHIDNETVEQYVYMTFKRNIDDAWSYHIAVEPEIINLLRVLFTPVKYAYRDRLWLEQPEGWRNLLSGPIKDLEDFFRNSKLYDRDLKNIQQAIDGSHRRYFQQVRAANTVRNTFMKRRKSKKAALERKLDTLIGVRKIKQGRVWLWEINGYHIRISPNYCFLALSRADTPKVKLTMNLKTLLAFFQLELKV